MVYYACLKGSTVLADYIYLAVCPDNGAVGGVHIFDTAVDGFCCCRATNTSIL